SNALATYAGSARPGEPPRTALAAQALGSAPPNEGRASTRECPVPSAVTGQGQPSSYVISCTIAPAALRSRTVPPAFDSELVKGPTTFVMPYWLLSSPGEAATTRKLLGPSTVPGGKVWLISPESLQPPNSCG